MSSATSFREVQRFGPWWVWPLVLVAAGGAIFAFLTQVVIGPPPDPEPAPGWLLWLLVVLLGVGLPALFLAMRLVVEVHADGIDVRFRPFTHRSIPVTDIVAAQARTYRPVIEYGGWGIKGWTRKKVAYNVSGNQGVELRLRDGRSIMLGSQRFEELETAIRAILPGLSPCSR